MSREELRLVTPDYAKKLLENNYDKNRCVKKNHVAELASFMKRGAFFANNGQTMLVDEDGVLYDGQHRCLAVIESDRPQLIRFVVAKDKEEAIALFRTLDNGAKRRVSDFINTSNRTFQPPIASFMIALEKGTSPLTSALDGSLASPRRGVTARPARDEVLDYIDSHEIVEEYARQGKRMAAATKGVGSPSAYGRFLALLSFCHKDEFVDSFVDDFCETVPIFRTVAAVKTKIKDSGKTEYKGTSSGDKALISLLLDAYHHFSAMDDSITLNKAPHRFKYYEGLVEAERKNRAKEETNA